MMRRMLQQSGRYVVVGHAAVTVFIAVAVLLQQYLQRVVQDVPAPRSTIREVALLQQAQSSTCKHIDVTFIKVPHINTNMKTNSRLNSQQGCSVMKIK